MLNLLVSTTGDKLSAVEFRVTVPVLVRFPAAVRELVSLTVREPPELTVKFPWAKVLAITDTVVKSVNIFFILLVLFFEDYF